MADSAQTLLRRWDALRARDSTARSELQEIYDFVRPNRAVITQTVTEGQKLTQRLFDSTAPYASSILASSLHGTLTPSTQPWLSYEMRDDQLQAIKSVQDWLEDCAKRTYKALRQSNFNTSVHEMYLDLTDGGQGAIFIEEKDPTKTGLFGGLRFVCVPIGTYAISEDYEGRVDTLFRLFKLPARVAAAKWKGQVGEFIQQKADDPAKADEQVEILHAVYPRMDRTYGKRDSRNMPWASCYIGVQGKKKIDEGGFLEFPYCAPRWSKTSGETNGRGPSHTALPDVKSLNEAKRIMLQAAPLAMGPPSVEIDDAVVGEFDRSAFARIVVNPQGGKSVADIIQFLETRGKVDMSQFVLADLRQAVREMYFVPQLQLQDGPQMTATEVQVKYELMQRILGPTTGRLEAEFLNPLVERIFRIMARARAFSAMPAELVQAQEQDMADLDIRYEGPMARAQRTIELAAQDRVVSFAMNLAAAKGSAEPLDILRVDKMIRERGEVVGLPSDQLLSDEEITEIRNARAAAAQQQQQAMMLAEGAKAIGGGQGVKALSEVAAPMNGTNGAR